MKKITNNDRRKTDLDPNVETAIQPRRPTSAPLSALLLSMLAASAYTLSTPAISDIGATHTTLVSEFASFNTPGVVDGRVEAIAVDGDTVFVGGTFTQIHDPLSDEIINQAYLFAYSKSTGDIIRNFDPVLNNSVLALETTGEGTGVFAGGRFNELNGELNNRGLLKINDNGDRASGFGARPNALVKTLVRLNDTLYVGGNFTDISNTPVELIAAIDTANGAVHPSLNLDFDGTITTGAAPNAVQSVDDVDVTSDGSLMVIVGNFEAIDGNSRPRLAVIELENQAKVSTWNSDVYDVQCPVQRLPQYIRGIDIAPDDSYFVVGSQGFRRRALPACDSIVRFDFGDLNNVDVQPTWINYTGGDSVYEVVATDHAIYVGGHFRWLTNDAVVGGDAAGPGSQERRGLGALDPINGLTLLDWRSDRSPRGVGIFAMIAEDEGLYLGDDTDFLNGSQHKKLKFLPITQNTINRPNAPTLPTTIVSNNGTALEAISFNGNTLAAPSVMPNSEIAQARAAMFVGGRLFQAYNNSTIWMSQFTNGAFEPRVQIDLFGLTNNEWEISRIGGMFFDYEQGRVYYTLQGDSRLFWRPFTPDGPYFGNDGFVAEQQGDIFWGDVNSMDVVDGHLYFTRNDGNLFRADIDGASPIAGTTVAISGPNIDGRRWNNSLLSFLSEGTLIQNTELVSQLEFNSSGSQATGRYRTFDFPVTAGEPVVLRLEWLDPNANLRLFVRNQNGDLVASDTTTAGSPKFLTVPAATGGNYTAAVLIAEGGTSYTLQVNPDEQAPAPLADFEFSSNGDAVDGRFQVFDFDVVAGELVEANLNWDNPNADVRVFLRDENNGQVDRETNGSGAATVSTIATTSGRWSVAVLIRSGAVNYDLLVDTTSDFVVPEPLADFVFNSSGTDVAANGRFQTFNFDVTAGESLDAQITWDDPNADVRVFLRDENNIQVDRDTTGSGTASVSTVATTSGRWSIAVLVRDATGTVNYDILVNTGN